MIAVGCVLASEQHLRLQDTRSFRRNSAARAGSVENNREKGAWRV